MKKLAAVLLAGAAIGVFTGCGNGGSDIGRDAALEAALNDAGVSESDTSRLQVSEERDDGRKIYEIRFDVGQTEYDYEILASDGQVISSDIDTDTREISFISRLSMILRLTQIQEKLLSGVKREGNSL